VIAYPIAMGSQWEQFSPRWKHNVCLHRLGRAPIVIWCGNLSFRARGD